MALALRNIVVFNKALIKSFRKRQNTVESRIFGSKLVALRIAREIIVEIRIKLKMFGVPLDGPANVFCDNNGIVKNRSIPAFLITMKSTTNVCVRQPQLGLCTLGRKKR